MFNGRTLRENIIKVVRDIRSGKRYLVYLNKKTNFYTQRFELKSWYIVLRKPIRYKPPFIDNFYVEEKYSISEGIVKFYWKCSKCKIAHESGSLEIAKAKAEHHESMMHKAKPVATFGWSTEKSQYTKVLG